MCLESRFPKPVSAFYMLHDVTTSNFEKHLKRAQKSLDFFPKQKASQANEVASTGASRNTGDIRISCKRDESNRCQIWYETSTGASDADRFRNCEDAVEGSLTYILDPKRRVPKISGRAGAEVCLPVTMVLHQGHGRPIKDAIKNSLQDVMINLN